MDLKTYPQSIKTPKKMQLVCFVKPVMTLINLNFFGNLQGIITYSYEIK